MKSQINGPKINFLFDSSQIQNGTNKILNNYETWYTELRQKKFTSKQDFLIIIYKQKVGMLNWKHMILCNMFIQMKIFVKVLLKLLKRFRIFLINGY